MDEQARRKAFVSDEANLDLVAQDLAEAIRDLLRALAAKDPSPAIARLSSTIRTNLRIYGEDLPAERVLAAAVAQLVCLDEARAQGGAIVDTARSALSYFAEATATDNFAEARLSKAQQRYENDIKNIDALNKLRRDRVDGS